MHVLLEALINSKQLVKVYFVKAVEVRICQSFPLYGSGLLYQEYSSLLYQEYSGLLYEPAWAGKFGGRQIYSSEHLANG